MQVNMPENCDECPFATKIGWCTLIDSKSPKGEAIRGCLSIDKDIYSFCPLKLLKQKEEEENAFIERFIDLARAILKKIDK